MSAVQFIPAHREPEEWPGGGEAMDLRAWATATVQVSGLSGGDSITVSASLDDTAYAPVSGMARADAVIVAVIEADGVYDFPATGFLKWTQTGGASTPTLILRAGA